MIRTAEAPETETLQDSAVAEQSGGEPSAELSGQEADEEFHSGKIYCANCIHCKLVPAKSEKEEHYVLRIRCAAGKWKKKLGEEKLYKYCTITRRYLDACGAYDAMGDTREFIRELRKNLSGKDEIYGSPETEE
jgi:hypothetical protein